MIKQDEAACPQPCRQKDITGINRFAFHKHRLGQIRLYFKCSRDMFKMVRHIFWLQTHS